MRDQAIEIAAKEPTGRAKRNRLREYLQHVLLRQLFERDMLDSIVFHGGTALRIVHDLPRFSEDLDFHSIRPMPNYDLGAPTETLRRDLEVRGYRVTVTTRLEGAVQSWMWGFEGLLYDCGLSPDPRRKLKVKLEVDTNPPSGFQYEKRLVNTYFPYAIMHHDRATFLAGKLHAILQRRFVKGRDFFDLFFYLSRWQTVSPNLRYLNLALQQTRYTGPEATEQTWRALAAGRVRAVQWGQVQKDVEPFVLHAEDLKAFRKEFLLQLLEGEDSGRPE